MILGAPSLSIPSLAFNQSAGGEGTMSSPRHCDVQFEIAPSSSKWLWVEWPKREIGTATITVATWTLPSGWTEAATSTSGLRTGIRVTAPSSETSTPAWIELSITTSASETLYARVGAKVTKDAH